MTTKYIDHLTEDKPITGQQYVCLSFLSPEGIKNCSMRGLKIRGVFATKEEADKHAHKLQSEDGDFHVFVGEVGKWLPWDPDANSVEDQRYHEEKLNELMKGYKDNREKAARMEDQRKKDMLKQAAIEKGKEDGKTKDRLKKKLEARKKDNSVKEPETEVKLTEEEKELKLREEELKATEELAKSERLRLEENKKVIENKENKLLSLDEKIAKIKESYKKIKEN